MTVFFSTLLSAVIIGTYIISVCIRTHGIPASISVTYYRLKDHIVFTIVMWLTAGLALPGIIAVGQSRTEVLGIIFTVGAFIVGALPSFLQHRQKIPHYIGAGMAIVGSFLWVAFNRPVMLSVWIPYILYIIVAYVILKGRKNPKPVFWAEIADFASTYGAIFMLLSAHDDIARHCIFE